MKYADAVAFRRALEDRLKEGAGGDGARIARNRKRVVFVRLLARLATVAPGRWALKGGFALDMRLADKARTTKDIDIAWQAWDDEVLDTLIEASSRDLGDYFAFNLERTDNLSPDDLAGPQRFRVTVALAGRPFETFVLDVGRQDDVDDDVEQLITPDLLGFAGIEPVAVPTIPLTQQVAEKLHAYTRIYEGGRASTRVKDLVDLALVAQLFSLDAATLRGAIHASFVNRDTHVQPLALPLPPEQWRAPFGRLASTVGLDDELETGYAIAAAMLDPILEHRIASGTWRPDAQQWTST